MSEVQTIDLGGERYVIMREEEFLRFCVFGAFPNTGGHGKSHGERRSISSQESDESKHGISGRSTFPESNYFRINH